jgi:hypothetical protein
LVRNNKGKKTPVTHLITPNFFTGLPNPPDLFSPAHQPLNPTDLFFTDSPTRQISFHRPPNPQISFHRPPNPPKGGLKFNHKMLAYSYLSPLQGVGHASAWPGVVSLSSKPFRGQATLQLGRGSVPWTILSP